MPLKYSGVLFRHRLSIIDQSLDNHSDVDELLLHCRLVVNNVLTVEVLLVVGEPSFVLLIAQQ